MADTKKPKFAKLLHEDPNQVVLHILDRLAAVQDRQQPLLIVELAERFGLVAVDFETLNHGLRTVVVALEEGVAAEVAAAHLARWVHRLVEGPAAYRADPAAAQAFHQRREGDL